MSVIGQSDFLCSSSKGGVLPLSLNYQQGAQLHLNLPIWQRTEWSQKCHLPISQPVSMTPKHIHPSWNSESPLHYTFFPFSWFSLILPLCPLIITIPPFLVSLLIPCKSVHPALTIKPYYVGCSPGSTRILIFAQVLKCTSHCLPFTQCPAPDILYFSIKIHPASQCPIENLHPIGCWPL